MRKLIKINKDNWSNFYDDATQRMFGCEPEMLINFTPYINLFVFDYGRLKQNIHFYVGCELTPAKVEDRDRDIVDTVSHAYMNFSLSEENLQSDGTDENSFILEGKPELDEVHFFRNESDLYSFFMSEAALLGLRVSEGCKEDMECRVY
ncbi:hypothetical protein [Flammeovirga sp. OC4]|uniref:hypothetical protein n=1 Tax=Flammeovirga sp. OC4 TaxID=1382345 RepID=UPI0012E0103C|nr:hypothetical protein [Flammeovirga sp. OC4]